MNTETENGTQVILGTCVRQSFRMQTAGALEHHARTSQSQGSEKECLETDQALYEKFLESWKNSKKKTDLNGLSMKMLRECFIATEDLTSYQSSLEWTDLGTISNGKISTAYGSFHKTGSAYTLSDILEDMVPQKYYLSKEQIAKIVFQRTK